MGLKKNNPGCECCGKILVWDLGRQSGSWDGTYEFTNWTDVLDYYQTRETESGDSASVEVDFVTGRVRSPVGVFDDPFYLDDPSFDPYTTAVEDGFWTGNIFDYRLVFWPFPAADTDLDGAHLCGLDPDFVAWTQPGTADHEFWGGMPRWWDDVATGRWSGRIVWYTRGSAGGSFLTATIGLATNVFLNQYSDVHGLDIDDEHYQWPFGGNQNDTTILDSDLTENVDDWSPATYPATRINAAAGVTAGATTFDELVEANDADLDVSVEWCMKDFDEEETLEPVGIIAARSRIEKTQEGSESTVPVDYLIIQGGSVFRAAYEDSTSFDAWYNNLWEVPIRGPGTIGSG